MKLQSMSGSNLHTLHLCNGRAFPRTHLKNTLLKENSLTQSPALGFPACGRQALMGGIHRAEAQSREKYGLLGPHCGLAALRDIFEIASRESGNVDGAHWQTEIGLSRRDGISDISTGVCDQV
jgi:hypothetical protein